MKLIIILMIFVASSASAAAPDLASEFIVDGLVISSCLALFGVGFISGINFR